MGEEVVEVVGAEESSALMQEVCAAYQASHEAPPNCEGPVDFARQRRTFPEVIEEDGFALAVARLGGQVGGFAYGSFLIPGTRWWEGMPEPLPQGFTEETGTRTFGLYELGVVPELRRQGIGRRLHDAVLDGCTAERATLACEPRLVDNLRLYTSWGWRCVGRTGARNDAYDIFVISLPIGRP